MKIKSYSTSLVFSILVSINDANIIDLIQKNNLEFRQLQNKSNQSELIYETTNLIYKPYITGDISSEKDDTDTAISNLKIDQIRKKYTAILGKNFLTGTALTLEATRLDYQSGLIPTSLSTNFNQNYLALNLQQSIYPNFFGSIDRSKVNINYSQMQKEQIQLKLDQIDLIKNKLANYWKLKILEIQIQKNRELISKYEILYQKVKQKNKNGLSNPGEAEQTEAELIQRKQNLSDDFSNSHILRQQLRQDLALSPDQDFKIETETLLDINQLNRNQIDKKINPKIIKIENTLMFQLQSTKTVNARNAYDAALNSNLPEISLYGRYTQQGLDASQAESMDEFNRADKNKYLIGLKVNYYFGSNINELNYKIRKQEFDSESTNTIKVHNDLKNYFQNLAEKINVATDNKLASLQILELRSQITKKILKSYNQGRTDISVLIDAYGKEALAEVNMVTAFGQYNQLVYEYQANAEY